MGAVSWYGRSANIFAELKAVNLRSLKSFGSAGGVNNESDFVVVNGPHEPTVPLITVQKIPKAN